MAKIEKITFQVVGIQAVALGDDDSQFGAEVWGPNQPQERALVVAGTDWRSAGSLFGHHIVAELKEGWGYIVKEG